MKFPYLIILIAFALSPKYQVQATGGFIPSIGYMARSADTAIRGSFVNSGTNLCFDVERVVRGSITNGQRVAIADTNERLGEHDLKSFVSSFESNETCLVLGNYTNGVLQLPWLYCSIWPQAVGTARSVVMPDIDAAELFVSTFVEYSRLETNNEEQFIQRIISDLQRPQSLRHVLAYFDSGSTWTSPQENETTREKVMPIIAAYACSSVTKDDWTVGSIRRISPSFPVSIVVPYFLEVANSTNGERRDAVGVIKSSLKLRGLLASEITKTKNLSALTTNAVTALPKLRQMDAKKYVKLFDTRPLQIATNAPIVFRQIYGEPGLKSSSLPEQKAFWLRRASQR